MDGRPVTQNLQQERQGNVLVLSMARAPVNALDAGLIAELRDALAEARQEPDLRAVVIGSELPQFSVGLDISELGRVAGPGIADLCAEIEDMPVPVVAALRGSVLGGGLEIALACHVRLADAKARLGLPEISLGLLPGAGATQRLPRLVGAGPALHLLLDGVLIAAGEALAIGLIDQVVEEALIPRAVAHARTLIGQPLRRTCERREGMRDGLAYQTALAAARTRIEGSRMPASERIVACIEAAQILPFDQGLWFERAAYEDMVATPESAGLRHAFSAERRALAPPAAVTAVTAPGLTTVGILGAGGAAAEVARMALGAGLRVILVDPDRPALLAALERIAARHELMVSEGTLAPEARDADWGRLLSRQDAGSLAEADLILAQQTGAPEGKLVIGLGGTGPLVLHPAAQAGGLAELDAAPGVAVAAQAAGLVFARRLGWRLMFAGPGGPVERRLRTTLSRVIAHLEQGGLSRADIATALAGFGLGAAARRHLPPAPRHAADVVPACLAALANDGARMLEEKLVRRPAQVDAAAVLSGLFPRWEGGPMYLADRRGLLVLRADLRKRAEAAPALYTPAPLIETLIDKGLGFGSLNGER